MKPFHVALSSVVLAALLAAPAARALVTRTWVSGVGNDANPCSRTAPCRTFAAALALTSPGGEISVLDPGSYGTVTITKAVTINGDGTLAGIVSSGTAAITVNAGVNDRVVLRNISLFGTATGANGIRFLAGKSLLVESVLISTFITRGIEMNMTAAAKLIIRDSTIANGLTGIFVNTTGGLAQVALENVHLTGLATGVDAAANSRVMISNSVVSGNSSIGVLASSSTARINLEGSQVSFNDVAGINASVSGSIVRLANNEIFNNNAGVSIAAGATVESAGNNRVQGNVSSTSPNGAIVVH